MSSPCHGPSLGAIYMVARLAPLQAQHDYTYADKRFSDYSHPATSTQTHVKEWKVDRPATPAPQYKPK